jgi:iron complex transport system permease protein
VSVRALGVLAASAGVVVLATATSLALGARQVDVATLVQAWTDYSAADADHAVAHARLPRTVLGLLVGGALGLAGAAMQGVARNPLADPGILGVNAGAAFAVVVAVAWLGVAGLSGYLWFSFAGAAGAAVLVYAVASLGREGATPLKLALAGAATSAGLVSLTNAVLVTDQAVYDRFRFWEVGSVAGRGWPVVVTVLPFLALGTLVALLSGRALNGLALGDDAARVLGQRVGLSRAATAVAIVLLCGAATAAAGPIAFVGLVVPHAARALAGGDYRWLLPISCLLGAALLVVADSIGRVLAPPTEIQVGLMTALVGAPVFVALVRRRKVVGL